MNSISDIISAIFMDGDEDKFCQTTAVHPEQSIAYHIYMLLDDIYIHGFYKHESLFNVL